MADEKWTHKMLELFQVLGIDEKMVGNLEVVSGSDGVTIKVTYLEQYRQAVRRG